MGIVLGPNGKIWAVNATTSELLLIEPDAIAGVPELSTTILLNAYPNPAKDRVQVSLERYAGGTVRLELLDAAGRLVVGTTATANRMDLDVSGMPVGLYQLRATLADGHQLQQPLMIAR